MPVCDMRIFKMARNFLKQFFSFAIVLLSFSSFAATTSNTAANDLAKLLEQYNSLTAQFNQTVYDTKGHALQSSSGSMAMLRPDKLRWSIENPSQQIIATDGSQLWVYDKDLQQVTVSQLKKKPGTTPAMLITTSAQELTRDYKISYYVDSKTKPVFQLIPNVKNPDFQWVRLFFNHGQINKMQIQDNIGQLTSINFTKINTNPALLSSIFVLKIPKNVDVIQQP